MAQPLQVAEAGESSRPRRLPALLPEAGADDGAPSPDLNDAAVLRMARRVFFKRFGPMVLDAHICLDDAWHDVVIGLLTRSRGGSRWDPTRGGLSTWLYVAERGIVLNLVDAERRRVRRSGTVGAACDVAEEILIHDEFDGNVATHDDHRRDMRVSRRGFGAWLTVSPS
jgi:hypothetical protein